MAERAVELLLLRDRHFLMKHAECELGKGQEKALSCVRPLANIPARFIESDRDVRMNTSVVSSICGCTGSALGPVRTM